MKLLTFQVPSPTGPHHRVGVLDGTTVVDVTEGYAQMLAERGESCPGRRALAVAPPDMLELLCGGETSLDAVRDVLAIGMRARPTVGPTGARLRYDLDTVVLQSPLPRPNSLRDFITFEQHVGDFHDEIPDAWYDFPVYYKGNPDTVLGPGTDVRWPSFTDQLDYELEVSAVVGKRGSDIPATAADEYIAGYTIFNDFSARDIQQCEMTVGLGPAKGKDFANGLGPYLVTADEFDPTDAQMVARVDGEVWSRGNLGEMYHSFADMVEHASRGETLHPGDVLGSGTVGGGCGAELDRWIEPGATVELEVEGLGTLEHRITDTD